jgi:hypothetical protein
MQFETSILFSPLHYSQVLSEVTEQLRHFGLEQGTQLKVEGSECTKGS